MLKKEKSYIFYKQNNEITDLITENIPCSLYHLKTSDQIDINIIISTSISPGDVNENYELMDELYSNLIMCLDDRVIEILEKNKETLDFVFINFWDPPDSEGQIYKANKEVYKFKTLSCNPSEIFQISGISINMNYTSFNDMVKDFNFIKSSTMEIKEYLEELEIIEGVGVFLNGCK